MFALLVRQYCFFTPYLFVDAHPRSDSQFVTEQASLLFIYSLTKVCEQTIREHHPLRIQHKNNIASQLILPLAEKSNHYCLQKPKMPLQIL